MTSAMTSSVKKSKLEFDVQMTCNSCSDSVRQALDKINIHDYSIDLENEKVIVETHLPYTAVLNALEGTGRKAVLKGYGSSGGQGLETAVCELNEHDGIVGVVRFLQLDQGLCIVDGTLDGLGTKQYNLAVHEFGDLSEGCASVGDVYNPPGQQFQKPYGDLGEISGNDGGRSMFRKENDVIKVSDIIGRSLVVIDENQKNMRLGCGIIARSAGLFQNPKKICQCDGKTIWEEREQAQSKM